MKRRSLAAMVVALSLVLLVWQGMALAIGGPGDILPDDPNKESNEAYSPQVQPAEPPDEPTSDDDLGGHDTSDPEKPDHAAGSIAEVTLAGEELVVVGDNNAQIEDDGQASGDVVVLALLGSEIIGAHSNCPAVDCEGGTAEDGLAPGILCEETGGGVCVGLLFAETTSSVTSEESSATADQALAFACIGSTQTQPEANCDGVVGAGVSENHSDITQDNTTGATTANQTTDVADVCVGPTGEDPITGTCSGLGASALHSESHSTADSETAPGTTERSSYLLAVEIGGTQALVIDEPTAIELPPGCPEGGSLLCVYLNQGESFVYAGGAGSHQEALHISVLRALIGGEDLVLGHVSDAETLVENTGPACPPGSTAAHCVPNVCPDTGLPPMPDGSCPREPRGLPVTGLDLAVQVAGALLLLVGGSHLVAWDRRRVLA